MKFPSFREYKGNLLENSENAAVLVLDVVRYLSIDLVKGMRELTNGLSKLTFDQNFESFETTVTIPASSELAIRNELRGVVPTKRLIVRGGTGAYSVVDGDTAWTTDYVYMKNTSGSSVTVTLVFLK